MRLAGLAVAALALAIVSGVWIAATARTVPRRFDRPGQRPPSAAVAACAGACEWTAPPRSNPLPPTRWAQVAAGRGEIRGLDLTGVSREAMRELARIAEVRDVTLAWPEGAHDEVGFVEDLEASGLLARITQLEIACDACVERLARARTATRLRVLRAKGCTTDDFLEDWHDPCAWLSARAARRLASSAAFPGLTDLVTSARGPALAALLDGPLAARLHGLHVMVTPAGMTALGNAPRLGRLERLAIHAPAVSSGSARPVIAVVTSPHLQRLRTLTFVSADSEGERTLSSDGMRALARHMRLRSVRELDVSGAYVGDDGLVELVTAPWLSQLERLDIAHTGLEDQTGADARAALAVRGPWPGLRALAIGAADPEPLAGFGGVIVRSRLD